MDNSLDPSKRDLQTIGTEADQVIFDRDHWQVSDKIQSQYNIQALEIQANGQNLKFIQKINDQLEKSKGRFFKQKANENPRNNNSSLSKQKKLQSISLSQKLIKNTNNILKQGLVEKKTDGFFFKWNIRYMVLTSDKLYSFENAKKIKKIGCINLKLLRTKLIQKNLTITLDFDGQCENVILKLSNLKQRQEWKNCLKQVIDFQSRQDKILFQTLKKPIYDSKDTLTEAQFGKYAETGDILLFNTNHMGAQLQRIVTNSEFDHVAMVIKFGVNDVAIFECNPIDGVQLYQWNMFIKYFNLYQQVTMRKLHSIRKGDLHQLFLNFAKANIGKNYEIGPLKLLKMQSDFEWGLVKQQQNRGYFCSQLIAKAFKIAGLLDPIKSSTQYWPVDFTEKNGLKLLSGASLGHQQVIVLNKHLKKKL